MHTNQLITSVIKMTAFIFLLTHCSSPVIDGPNPYLQNLNGSNSFSGQTPVDILSVDPGLKQAIAESNNNGLVDLELKKAVIKSNNDNNQNPLPSSAAIHQEKETPLPVNLQVENQYGIPLLDYKAAGLTDKDQQDACKVIKQSQECIQKTYWYGDTIKTYICGISIEKNFTEFNEKIENSNVGSKESYTGQKHNAFKERIKICGNFGATCLRREASDYLEFLTIHVGCI